jgi:hypothetical protein
MPAYLTSRFPRAAAKVSRDGASLSIAGKPGSSKTTTKASAGSTQVMASRSPAREERIMWTSLFFERAALLAGAAGGGERRLPQA